MSWLVVLPLHRTSTLLDIIMQPWRYFLRDSAKPRSCQRLGAALVPATETEASVRGERCASVLGCPPICGAPRSWSQQSSCSHYQTRFKASYNAWDELLMGYKPGEKGGGENHAIWTAPLGPELKQKYQGYEVKQYNIIMDVLGGWCPDLEVQLKQLVESKE